MLGGGSTYDEQNLHHVTDLCSTDAAFAARRSDGSVVAFGDPQSGGSISHLAEWRCEKSIKIMEDIGAE